jgi:hypothetical protein
MVCVGELKFDCFENLPTMFGDGEYSGGLRVVDYGEVISGDDVSE